MPFSYKTKVKLKFIWCFLLFDICYVSEVFKDLVYFDRFSLTLYRFNNCKGNYICGELFAFSIVIVICFPLSLPHYNNIERAKRKGKNSSLIRIQQCVNHQRFATTFQYNSSANSIENVEDRVVGGRSLSFILMGFRS